jgi:3-phenylpropionate/trans-cinnamate dioxygenase ferredoxin reductase component
MSTFVIVGAGLAGAKAAETLRAEGYDGRLVLLGEEAERPYDRPPLSKTYLRGEADRDSLYVHDASFYAAESIELHTSARVSSIDPAARQLQLASGKRLGYRRLLLATGAAPHRLRLPGADLDGVYHLRTRRDADRLATAVGRAERVVVIGTGWIGCEVAASVRRLGREVTLIGPDAVPLARALGPEIGGFYRDVHAEHGVRLELGTCVDAFRGDGHVEAIVTGAGRTLPCDLVLVGIGATPRTELAAAAGLALGDGVLVDEWLETIAPGIYAAGDVAAAWHPHLQTRLRIGHRATALHQGLVAARTMLGRPARYERLPYISSNQYDIEMEYSGLATTSDRVVIRGDLATRKFVAFWVRRQRVVAGMSVNVWDVAEPIQALIRGGREVDLARLADPDIPIQELPNDGGRSFVARRWPPPLSTRA